MSMGLGEFVSGKGGVEILEMLADRLPEGIVFVDNTYKILYINRVIRNEFLTSGQQDQRVVGEPYFDFFFKSGITNKEKAEYPIWKAFKECDATPFKDTKLAKNNNYYDIIVYPVQCDSAPKIVMEVWSEFGSQQFVDALKDYKELK